MRINKFFKALFAGKLSNPCDFKEALRVQRASDKGNNTLTERFFGTLESSPHFDAPERLRVGKSVFTGEMYLRQQHRADWQNVDIDVQLFTARLIEACRRKGIPMYAHSAIRTKDEQNALVAKGVSKARYPRAPHVQGAAVDIVHSLYHWSLTDDEWKLIGKIGKQVAHQLGIEMNWGGDETGKFEPFTNVADTFRWDPAHWELQSWRDHYDATPPETGTPVRKTARKLLAETKGYK